MKTGKKTPDYVFEASWEVCNKVGGIYTVLSTHAKTLQETICPNLIFIGPDFEMIPSNPLTQNPLFTEDSSLYADWLKAAAGELYIQGYRLKIFRRGPARTCRAVEHPWSARGAARGLHPLLCAEERHLRSGVGAVRRGLAPRLRRL